MFNIRPFRDGDLEPVAALWERCGLNVPDNDPATDIAFCRASADAELFVGDICGPLIATVMTGHDGHRGWRYYLAVDPAQARMDWGAAWSAAPRSGCGRVACPRST